METCEPPATGQGECALRLDCRFRALLYATVIVLFVTGAAWLPMERLRQDPAAEPWNKGAAYLLMLHGGAAMLMLVLIGALIPIHSRVSWRRKENRISGTVMLAANAVLILTAFGLYYLGSETLRRWTSDLHTFVGLGVPILVAAHVLAGRAAVRASHRDRIARRTRLGESGRG
jgi:4-amino-4-deoxy-L-arabinose transferase-like glycosyltransferase